MKVKINRSKYDIVVGVLCLLLLCGFSLYLLINWGNLPERIPGHFNGAGEIDRWGSKWELVFCQLMAWFCYLGISVVERFPQIWNAGVTVTAENMGRVYRILKDMIGTLKLYMVCAFSGILIGQLRAVSLPGWYLWGSLGLTAALIAFFIVKLNKNK